MNIVRKLKISKLISVEYTDKEKYLINEPDKKV